MANVSVDQSLPSMYRWKSKITFNLFVLSWFTIEKTISANPCFTVYVDEYGVSYLTKIRKRKKSRGFIW